MQVLHLETEQSINDFFKLVLIRSDYVRAYSQGYCVGHRVNVGEIHNPNTWANIQHQLTRTVPTHAMVMYV